jgi:hypothetical protein
MADSGNHDWDGFYFFMSKEVKSFLILVKAR